MLKEAVLGPSSKTMNPSFEEQLRVDYSKLQAIEQKTSNAVMLKLESPFEKNGSSFRRYASKFLVLCSVSRYSQLVSTSKRLSQKTSHHVIWTCFSIPEGSPNTSHTVILNSIQNLDAVLLNVSNELISLPSRKRSSFFFLQPASWNLQPFFSENWEPLNDQPVSLALPNPLPATTDHGFS